MNGCEILLQFLAAIAIMNLKQLPLPALGSTQDWPCQQSVMHEERVHESYLFL